MPLEDQSWGGDSQDGATLPLTETIEKMEIDQEETEESEQHLKQKLEGEKAKVPLTEAVHMGT